MLPYYYYPSIGYWELILLLTAILSVIGGLVVYFTFMSRKKEGTFKNSFVKWLYDFLHFKVIVLDTISKVLYVVCAVFLTLFGVIFLFVGQGMVFILSAVVGNVLLRLAYELFMLFIKLVRNTSEIKNKLYEEAVENPALTAKTDHADSEKNIFSDDEKNT